MLYMKTKNIIILFISIGVLFAVCVYRSIEKKREQEKQQKEDDAANAEGFSLYCPNCSKNNWMGESDCYNCQNCGWCVDPNGYGQCTQGDYKGPYFKDCRSWIYKGQCMWGPECGRRGPIYVQNLQPPYVQNLQPPYVPTRNPYNIYNPFNPYFSFFHNQI